MPEAVLRFEITYTFEDLIGHARGPLHRRVSWSWHQLLLWGAIAGAAWAFFAFFRGDPRDGPPRTQSASEILSSLAIPVLAFTLFLVWRGRTMRRARREWDHRQIPPFALTLSREGLIWESNGAREEQAWDAYRAVVESPKAFLMQPIEGPEMIIPKRVMSADQVDRVRQLLQERVTECRGFPVLPNESANSAADVEHGKEPR